MKKTVILLLILMIISMFVSCNNDADNEKSNESEAVSAEKNVTESNKDNTIMDKYEASTFVANNMMQMRKIVPSTANSIVYLKGYYYPEDGGGGTFYWDPESTAEADGGIVIKPNDADVGRFIRACEPNVRNVKWFGATGGGSSDDTKAIQAAINSLPSNGGTVSFPGGKYIVKDTLLIGNGDGNLNHSATNGIKLVGEGGGFGVWGDSVPTYIDYKGISGKSIISVNGRISDVTIEGMQICGNGLADICISLTAVQGLTVKEVCCTQFMKYGIYMIGGVGELNACSDCTFKSISVITINDNVKCVCLDGNDSTSPNRNLLFNDCRFDSHTTVGSTSLYIAATKDSTFLRCHFVGSDPDSSKHLVLDASMDGYPNGLSFHDCSIGNMTLIEENGNEVGHNMSLGHGTSDNEVITDIHNLWGITDYGIPFGCFGNNQ